MFGWKRIAGAKAGRMTEQTGAYDGGADAAEDETGATGAMTGIIGTTRLATPEGWRDAATLQAGDMVMTFDGGFQPLRAVRRRLLWSGPGPCPERFWPLLVPAGAIENVKPMTIPPRQGVMLESDLAERALGDPFALIPAAALEGARGVERVFPKDAIEVICLDFGADQVVFAEHGALLFCPAGCDLVQRALTGRAQHSPYRMLPEASAAELVSGRGRQTG